MNKLKAFMLFLIALVKAEWTKFKTWYSKKWIPFAMRFLTDTRANGTESKIVDWIGLTIALIFGVYLLPVVVDAVGNTNFTGWTFTGAAGAKVLYMLLPFIFIVGMIVYFIGRLLGKI